jgi:hypothetical protein
MIDILRRALLHALCALPLALIFGACGDDTPEPMGETRRDTGVTVVPLPMEGQRDTAFNPANVESFHEIVYKQYARMAVGLPRRVTDSIFASVPPTEIQTHMERALHGQDTIARRELAEKYGISRDSVDAILALKNVPKR